MSLRTVHRSLQRSVRLRHRWVAAATLVAASGGLAGCASAGRSAPADSLESQVAQLRATVVELQRKNTVNEVELQRLRVKVAELELAARRASRARESGARGSDELAQAAPAPPRTRREDPIQGAPRARIEQRELSPEIAAPPVLEPAPSSPAVVASGNPEPAPTASAPAALDQAAQTLYDQGYTEYNQRQFVAAEATFQRFLQRYPATSLADNAQYWIGEARYGRGDRRGALAAFRETVNRYPEGNKTPDALLRIGKIYEEASDVESALAAYREIQRLFPDSAEALLAGDRIRKLGG